jgi:hypothetical protein
MQEGGGKLKKCLACKKTLAFVQESSHGVGSSAMDKKSSTNVLQTKEMC